MYLIPLIAIVILALIAVAWSPIFALVLFAILFLFFLGYVGLSRRADQEGTTPEARAAARGREEEAETRIR
jgi:flagellar biosynthesis component FlhA